MATFKEIRGQLIRKYTTNPTDPLEGQMWYNNTTGTLKGIVATSAWSSGSPLANARFSTAGAGIQTAALVAGGYTTAVVGITEEYDGSGWSAGGALNQARYYIGGAGTQTSALAMSGRNPPAGWSLTNTEKYDGSSWTNSTVSPTALNQVTTTGTQTAALLWGGVNAPSSPNVSTTYEFDGSTWTSGGALPGVLKVAGAFGTQTAAMSAGNEDGSTLYYNGASWSDQSATIPYSGADYWNYAGTSGTQTAGVIAGGGPTAVTTTAIWDGSAWAANPALATARLTGPMGPIGTSTAGIVAGGEVSPGVTAATEEFNISANVVTAATWAAGPTLGTGRYGGVSGGTTTTAIFAGGGSPRDYNNTELYDGSSWTAVNNMNTGRGRISGTGTPTSAVGAGGYTPGALQSVAEQWDGTDWSNITSLPTARQYMGSIGASGTAALFIGGHSGGPNPSPGYRTDETLYWDGSSWAAGGTYPNPVWNPRGFGTVTAGISAGGTGGPTTSSNSYNGASWTAGPSLNLARNNAGASGATDSDGLIYGGGAELTAEKWDGTSFATSASFANTHDGGGSNQNGSSSTAMIFGGDSPGIALFEEFTPETTSANIVTVTTS